VITGNNPNKDPYAEGIPSGRDDIDAVLFCHSVRIFVHAGKKMRSVLMNEQPIEKGLKTKNALKGM
jgi:hypothetical protein